MAWEDLLSRLYHAFHILKAYIDIVIHYISDFVWQAITTQFWQGEISQFMNVFNTLGSYYILINRIIVVYKCVQSYQRCGICMEIQTKD